MDRSSPTWGPGTNFSVHNSFVTKMVIGQPYNMQAWSFAGNGQSRDNGGVPHHGRGEAQRLRQLPLLALQQEPDGGVAPGEHLRPRDQGRQHRPAQRGQQS